MLIYHKGHTDTIQVYSVTVMTHVKALQAGHSSQGTSEPITPAPQRVLPGVLLYALTEHYSSLRRLAGYRRQFERVSRNPGDDLSVFAIELETLAMWAFADLHASARLQLVRDRLIAGQMECSLRRHLDSVGPGTPIRDIVDCCGPSHAEDTDSWGAYPSPERPRPSTRLMIYRQKASRKFLLKIRTCWIC